MNMVGVSTPLKVLKSLMIEVFRLIGFVNVSETARFFYPCVNTLNITKSLTELADFNIIFLC